MTLQRLSGSRFQGVTDFKGTFKFKGSTSGAQCCVSPRAPLTPSGLVTFPWHQSEPAMGQAGSLSSAAVTCEVFDSTTGSRVVYHGMKPALPRGRECILPGKNTNQNKTLLP